MPIVTLEYEKEGRQEKLQFFPHPDHIFRHALQGSDEVIFVFELAYGRLLNGLSSGGPYVQVYLQLNVKYDVVVSGEVTTFPIQF